jgi:outer membrane biosynthesis protein TonB
VPAAPPLLGSTGSTTFVLAALLVALGIAMLVAAAWLTRATRTDVPALAPLEVMGDRRFARRDGEARAAVLAGVRPEGAIGPTPMVEIEPEPAPAPEPAVEDEPAADGVVAAPVDEEPVVVEEMDPAVEDGPIVDGEIVAEPEPEPEPHPQPQPEADETASIEAPVSADPVSDEEAAESAPRAH